MGKDHDLDGPDWSPQDARWLTLVATIADVDPIRVWYALAFRDRSALDEIEWSRLQRICL